jgi:hypothetical protein
MATVFKRGAHGGSVVSAFAVEARRHGLLLLVCSYSACSSTSEEPFAAQGGLSSAEKKQMCETKLQKNPDAQRPGSPPMAECYGCHPSFSIPESHRPAGPVPSCQPEGDEPVIAHTFEDLPCGSCSDDGAQCDLAVWAYCDCDGDGPLPPAASNEYYDRWVCECTSGEWECWIADLSGASCSNCSAAAE